MKKYLGITVLLLVLAGFLGGFTYAAFTDAATFEGSLITVGSADIKLYENLAKPSNEAGNLVDSKPSPNLLDITPTYQKDYPVKIYNNSTKPLMLRSKANYTTAEDPEDLRRYVLVQIYNWNDLDNSGTVGDGELENSIGQKNIIDWKTDGFEIGEIGVGGTKQLLLRFTSPTIPDDKQGKSGRFGFNFTSEGL